MRIAFVIPSLIQQGPVIVAHDLICGLMKEGHYCKVYYFDDCKQDLMTVKTNLDESITLLTEEKQEKVLKK